MAAERLIGKSWEAVNDEQRRFLSAILDISRGDLERLNDVLKYIASKSAAEINKFLADNGFPNLQISELGEDEFAVASVLDVLTRWVEVGENTQLTSRNKGITHEAVLIKAEHVIFYTAQGHANPIAEVCSQGNDRLFMTVLEKELDGMDLLLKAEELSKGLKPASGYSTLTFPMVHYDEEVDISWFVGMRNRRWHIAKAKQRTRFRMNETGARAQSAVAMVLRYHATCGRPVIIDEPFLVWIEREGVALPLFAGRFTEEHWKNPGSLDTA